MNTKHRPSKWVSGPGGFKCRCCGPAPKDRIKARRTERRVAGQTVAREILAALNA